MGKAPKKSIKTSKYTKLYRLFEVILASFLGKNIA
jgi:hypothetical protein